MTFRAFAEIIIIVGREEANSVLCLSVMYLFNGFRAKLSSTPNYPQSIHPERQTDQAEGVYRTTDPTK